MGRAGGHGAALASLLQERGSGIGQLGWSRGSQELPSDLNSSGLAVEAGGELGGAEGLGVTVGTVGGQVGEQMGLRWQGLVLD